MDLHEQETVNVQRLAEQQTKKVAAQYKTPFKIEKDKLRFEVDGYDPKKLYIVFNYTSDVNFYGNVYFNSTFDPKNPQS